MSVQGVARLAAIDADLNPGMAAAGTTVTADRLVTGVAQWMVPEDGTLWEVRLTGLNPMAPLGGAGVMQVVHGETGIGSDRFPRSLAYVAVYGPMDVYRNGERIATGLQGHILATQGIREPQMGRLLETASVRPQDIQIHVLVEGEIPGREEDSLYVFWPQATLDLRNLSQPVALLPEEIRTAQSFLQPAAAVAGFRAPGLPTPLVIVSLRERFLARSFAQVTPGEVELRVMNESSVPRGFYIQGPGIDQRTRLLGPGETETLRLTLMPGTYRLASFLVATPTQEDYMHWDTIVVQ